MATTTTIGPTTRTTEIKSSPEIRKDVSNRGIYWAIGIAIVLLAIVFAMRPLRDTPATSTTGTIMSESATTTTTVPATNNMQAVPVDQADRTTGGTQTDATSGATYDDGAVNNTTTTPPTQRQ